MEIEEIHLLYVENNTNAVLKKLIHMEHRNAILPLQMRRTLSGRIAFLFLLNLREFFAYS